MLQRENACSPISVTLSGIVMLVRLLQSLNAEFPIEVTLSGMVMLIRFLHLQKDCFSISVTPSGILYSVKPAGRKSDQFPAHDEASVVYRCIFSVKCRKIVAI